MGNRKMLMTSFPACEHICSARTTAEFMGEANQTIKTLQSFWVLEIVDAIWVMSKFALAIRFQFSAQIQIRRGCRTT
jgi:hypothetical protein